jgi:hypothetical protein
VGAAHAIAGFRYQLLQNVRALLKLQEGEQLLLEVSEDFSVVSASTSTDVQVKNSQVATGPPGFSLQSADIKAVLSRFWSGQTDTMRRLVFIARGGAFKERGFEFPESMPGLHYWRAAAIDAETAPLRESLASILAGTPLGAWIPSDPADAELRTRLLRRVEGSSRTFLQKPLPSRSATRSVACPHRVVRLVFLVHDGSRHHGWGGRRS